MEHNHKTTHQSWEGRKFDHLWLSLEGEMSWPNSRLIWLPVTTLVSLNVLSGQTNTIGLRHSQHDDIPLWALFMGTMLCGSTVEHGSDWGHKHFPRYCFCDCFHVYAIYNSIFLHKWVLNIYVNRIYITKHSHTHWDVYITKHSAQSGWVTLEGWADQPSSKLINYLSISIAFGLMPNICILESVLM